MAHNRQDESSNPSRPTKDFRIPVPVTGISFYDGVEGEEEIIDGWWCPFCDDTVKMGQKGYLMVCKKCGARID